MIFILFVVLVGVLVLATYMRRKEESRRQSFHERKQAKFEQLVEMLKNQEGEKKEEGAKSPGES